MAQEQVWVLADDRIGNVVQAVGLAEALNRPYRRIDVVYDTRGGMHNLFRGSTLLGIADSTRQQLTSPWPQLVIGAGRRTAPLARWIRRQCGARLVQMMDPGWPGRGDFDLIAVPRHDQSLRGPNVVETLGACHRVEPGLLAREAAQWTGRLPQVPRPWLLLSVGGNTKDYSFPPELIERLAADTQKLASRVGASVLALTSRRSGPDIEASLARHLSEPRELMFWRPGEDNPYLALLGLSDLLVVTGDSMNMCSEACATGKPTFIFNPAGWGSAKHRRLHQEMFDRGLAHALDDPDAPIQPHQSLTVAAELAQEVFRRGLLR